MGSRSGFRSFSFSGNNATTAEDTPSVIPAPVVTVLDMPAAIAATEAGGNTTETKPSKNPVIPRTLPVIPNAADVCAFVPGSDVCRTNELIPSEIKSNNGPNAFKILPPLLSHFVFDLIALYKLGCLTLIALKSVLKFCKA